MSQNKMISPYNDLLRPGHWPAFLDHAWQRTDCAEVSGHTTSLSWLRSVTGQEEQNLSRLFAASEYELHEIIDEYFFGLEATRKDHCQRCNASFAGPSRELCKFCGWDQLYIQEMEGDDLDKAISLNSTLNEQRVKTVLSAYQSEQAINLLGPTEPILMAECEQLEKQIATIQTKLDELNVEAEEKKERRLRLEMEARTLSDEIEELADNLKNAGSLFNLFEPLPHSRTLFLKITGSALVANSQPELLFPTDLIMALKQTKLPGAEIVKHASCFVFLKKEGWQQAGPQTWSFDVQTKTAGKVAADTYYAEFFHLQEEHPYKIKFITNKLTIR